MPATAQYFAAGFFAAVIVADVGYGVFLQRDSLLTWTQLLMGCLGLIALFFDSISKFTIGKEGVTVERLKAAAILGAAEATKPDSTRSAEDQATGIAEIIHGTSTRRAARGLANARILWVDDNPDNNILERDALEALGVRFFLSTSTDDATDQIANNRFDAIISDMGRPPDDEAGFTLLDKLKATGSCPPYIIYTGPNATSQRDETQRRGGWGITDRPNELFQLVLNALTNQGLV